MIQSRRERADMLGRAMVRPRIGESALIDCEVVAPAANLILGDGPSELVLRDPRQGVGL
jgi:hypothetical protein